MDTGRSTDDRRTDDESPLRLAIIGTPRSGNTWVRSTLAWVYALEEIPIHFLEQIDWECLPNRCVIQIHHYPTDLFRSRLAAGGFHVIVPARHPFDVLLSLLNLVYYTHQEGYCTVEGGCDNCAVVGATPRSEAFLRWAVGPDGRFRIGHSAAWWNQPQAIHARYEDLVADPLAGFGRILARVPDAPRRSLVEALESTAIGRLKSGREVWQYQYWQARPGHWRSFLTSAETGVLHESTREIFATLGYDCDPDEELGPIQADLNWASLQLESTREHLRLERSKHRQTQSELIEAQALAAADRELLRLERSQHRQTQTELIEAQALAAADREHLCLERSQHRKTQTELIEAQALAAAEARWRVAANEWAESLIRAQNPHGIDRGGARRHFADIPHAFAGMFSRVYRRTAPKSGSSPENGARTISGLDVNARPS